MKSPKWPRTPPSSPATGGSPSAFRPAWAHRKHGVPPPGGFPSKPRRDAKKPPSTDFSHLRFRKAPKLDEEAISRKRQEWPLLKRRSRRDSPSASEQQAWIDSEVDEAELARKLAQVGRTRAEFDGLRERPRHFGRAEIDWSKLESANQDDGSNSAEKRELSKEEMEMAKLDADAKKHMLIIRGVSSNLTASDFHRIAPRSLADWSSSIKKVEQQRHPETLRPLGCYQVSFISSSAAESYHLNLLRLQRLAQHKFSSKGGLWQATVPSHLLRPYSKNTHEDIAREVQSLTLASPSQPRVTVKKKRTATRNPWAADLKSLVRGCGYGEKPPVAVFSVAPGTISENDLRELLEQDGVNRNLAWKASNPMPLRSRTKQAHLSRKDQKIEDESKAQEEITAMNGEDVEEAPDTPGTHFILAFESDWEARNFHRSWHQRILATGRTGSQGRAMANVEVIEW